MNTTAQLVPRRPDLKDDRLALWIETNRFGITYYSIAEQLPYAPSISTTVSAKFHGITLSPQDALKLYRGDAVEYTRDGPYGSYKSIVAMRAIVVRPDPENAGRENRGMSLGLLMPFHRNGILISYKIVKWTPKVGQRGTDSINTKGTVQHVQETTSA